MFVNNNNLNPASINTIVFFDKSYMFRSNMINPSILYLIYMNNDLHMILLVYWKKNKL